MRFALFAYCATHSEDMAKLTIIIHDETAKKAKHTQVKIVKVSCEKCNHEYAPRTEKILKCPRCGHVPGTRIRKSVKGGD